jgi:hypothetical protein
VAGDGASRARHEEGLRGAISARPDGGGYSGTPLVRKLGLRPGWRIAVLGAPARLEELLGELPEGSTLVRRLGGRLDAVWLFATERRVLERRLPAVLAALPPDGTLWISWPKRASGLQTDIGEQTLRDVVLPTGWVDVKVAAVDATWSGLRFVLRRELRPARAPS